MWYTVTYEVKIINIAAYYVSHTTDTELHADSNIEDVDAIVAEIAGLMAKIERLHERELRAEEQARAVAERLAKKQVSCK